MVSLRARYRYLFCYGVVIIACTYGGTAEPNGGESGHLPRRETSEHRRDNETKINSTLRPDQMRKSDFHISTYCPGNFSTCMQGCPYKEIEKFRCIACDCSGMKDIYYAADNGIAVDSVDHGFPRYSPGYLPSNEESVELGGERKAMKEGENDGMPLQHPPGDSTGGAARSQEPTKPLSAETGGKRRNTSYYSAYANDSWKYGYDEYQTTYTVVAGGLFGNPKFERKVELKATTLFLGKMEPSVWNHIFSVKNASKLFNGSFPLVVYNVTRNAGNLDNGTDMSDFSDDKKWPGRPILLPVFIKEPLRKYYADPHESIPGQLHLPFRPKFNKSHLLPLAAFPGCRIQKLRKPGIEGQHRSQEKEGVERERHLLKFLPTIRMVLEKTRDSIKRDNDSNKRALAQAISCLRPRGSMSDAGQEGHPVGKLLKLLKRFYNSSSGNSYSQTVLESLNTMLNMSRHDQEREGAFNAFRLMVDQLHTISHTNDGARFAAASAFLQKTNASGNIRRIAHAMFSSSVQYATHDPALMLLHDLQDILNQEDPVKSSGRRDEYQGMMFCAVKALRMIDSQWLTKSVAKVLCGNMHGHQKSNESSYYLKDVKNQMNMTNINNTLHLIMRYSSSGAGNRTLRDMRDQLKQIMKEEGAPAELNSILGVVENLTRISVIKNMTQKIANVSIFLKNLNRSNWQSYIPKVSFLFKNNDRNGLKKFLNDSSFLFNHTQRDPKCETSMRSLLIPNLCKLIQQVLKLVKETNMTVVDLIRPYSGRFLASHGFPDGVNKWRDQNEKKEFEIGKMLHRVKELLKAKGVFINDSLSVCKMQTSDELGGVAPEGHPPEGEIPKEENVENPIAEMPEIDSLVSPPKEEMPISDISKRTAELSKPRVKSIRGEENLNMPTGQPPMDESSNPPAKRVIEEEQMNLDKDLYDNIADLNVANRTFSEIDQYLYGLTKGAENNTRNQLRIITNLRTTIHRLRQVTLQNDLETRINAVKTILRGREFITTVHDFLELGITRDAHIPPFLGTLLQLAVPLKDGGHRSVAEITACQIRQVMKALLSQSLCDEDANDTVENSALTPDQREEEDERVNVTLRMINRFNSNKTGHRSLTDMANNLHTLTENNSTDAAKHISFLIKRLARISRIENMDDRRANVVKFLRRRYSGLYSIEDFYFKGEGDLYVSFHNFLNESYFLFRDSNLGDLGLDLCTFSEYFREASEHSSDSMIDLIRRYFFRGMAFERNTLEMREETEQFWNEKWIESEIVNATWNEGWMNSESGNGDNERNPLFEVEANALGDEYDYDWATWGEDRGEMGVESKGFHYGSPNIGEIIDRHNITLGEEISLPELDGIFKGIWRTFSAHGKDYGGFLKNITRLATIFPFPNGESVKMCIAFFKQFEHFPEDVTPEDTDLTTKLRLCKDEIFHPFTHGNYYLTGIEKIFDGARKLIKQAKALDSYMQRCAGHAPSENNGGESVTYAAVRCPQHKEFGLLFPRPVEPDSVSAHGSVPVYLNVSRRPYESYYVHPAYTDAGLFGGLLWLNAGPKFNGTQFMSNFQSVAVHHQLKDGVKSEVEGDDDEDDEEDEDDDDGEDDDNSEDDEDKDEEEFWKNMNIALTPDDDMDEVFMLHDSSNNDVISIGTLFGSGSDVALWIHSGVWLTRDLKPVPPMPKRDADDEVSDESAGDSHGNENGVPNKAQRINSNGEETISPEEGEMQGGGDAVHNTGDKKNIREGATRCLQNVPAGWKCLGPREIVSSEAQIRFVTLKNNPTGVGILTAFPVHKTGNVTAQPRRSIADLTKAKNLIVMAPPPIGKKITGATFRFKKDVFQRELERQSLTTVTVRKLLQLAEIPTIQGYEMLQTFTKTNKILAKFMEQVAASVIWPVLQIQIEPEIVLDDIFIQYRPNSVSRWRSVTVRQTDKIYRTEIPSTAEFSLQPKARFKRGRRAINFQIQNGAKAILELKVVSPPFVMSMVVPDSYRLPAVSYDLEGYDGFPVSRVLYSLVREEDRDFLADDPSTIGIAITTPPRSKIGKWQYLCGKPICREWQNVGDLYTAGLMKSRQMRSLGEHGSTRERREDSEKTAACSYVPSVVNEIVLLHQDSSLRFMPNDPDQFWRVTEAWDNSVISLALFRIPLGNDEPTSNGTTGQELLSQLSNRVIANGAVAVNGTHHFDENCYGERESDDVGGWKSRVVDLTKLLSKEREKLAIERKGCDDKRSSMRTEIDRCGECGGDGSSCVDCEGVIYGNATLDDCGVCVGGNTKRKPTVRDCARRCDNSSYLDACEYCQNRNKPTDKRDCSGVCFGRAEPDKCGVCRNRDGSVAGELGEGSQLMDRCGVCGGNDSSCADCDGKPNGKKVLDECGNCKLPSNESFNEGCGEVYVIKSIAPSFVVIRSRESIEESTITIYGFFGEHDTATCSIRLASDQTMKVDFDEGDIVRKKKEENGVWKVVHVVRVSTPSDVLLPPGLTFVRWLISCSSGQGLSITSQAKEELIVRSLDPWELKDITPEFFTVGNGGAVVITGRNFPSNIELVCASVHSAFGAQSKTSAPRLMQTPAIVVDDSHVECEFEEVQQPAEIRVHVISKNEIEQTTAWKFQKNIEGGVMFEYRDKAPEVVDVRLSGDLAFIIVMFDAPVRFPGWERVDDEEFCDLVLEPSPILGKGAECYPRGSNKVQIRPGEGAVLETTTSGGTRSSRAVDDGLGEIILKRGAVTGRAVDAAFQEFPRTSVTVHKPENEDTPQITLSGTRELEPCGVANIAIRVSRGVGRWPVTFQWRVDVNENTPTNTPESLQKFLSGETQDVTSKRITFKAFQGELQPGGNYTIRVAVQNALGRRSVDEEFQIRVRDRHSSVRTSVIGPSRQTFPSSVAFKIRAATRFLKQKCAGDADDDDQSSLSASSVTAKETRHIWEVISDAGQSVGLSADSGRVLVVRRGEIVPGNYTVVVTVLYFNDGIEMGRASANVFVRIESSPLKARIVGPGSRVILTTETLSLDGSRTVDRDGKQLTFSWTCVEEATNAPCSVYAEGASSDSEVAELERADAAFPNYQTASGELNIPANLFPPEVKMNITLSVTDGARTATKSVLVLVKDASDNLPVISIKPLQADSDDGTVPVNKPLRIKAKVIGNELKNWTMILTWSLVEEDGLAYLNLSNVNLTKIEDVRKVTGSRNAEFPLVIAPYSLEPSSTYKLQVKARPDPEIHPMGDAAEVEQMTMYAEMTIKTRDVPKGGSLSVSPDVGTALGTEFEIQASDWIGADDDQPLYYRFAYKVTKKQEADKDDIKRRGLTFLGSYTDLPEISTYLPPGSAVRDHALRIFVFIRVGEDKGTTRVVTSEIIVTPPTSDGAEQVSEEVVKDKLNEAAEALISGDMSATVSSLALLKQSLGSGDQADPDAVEKTRELASATLKSMDSISLTTESDASDALEAVNTLLGAFPTTSTESKEVVTEVIDNTLKLFKKGVESRRRRAADDPTATSNVPTEMAEKILDIYDKIFDSSSNDPDFLADTKIQFKEDTEFIMKSFCNDIAYGEPAQTVETDFSFVSTRKIEMEKPTTFDENSLTFSFHPSIENAFSNWDCDTSAEACTGACVAHGVYQMDVLEYYDTADDSVTRVGPIVGLSFRNPTDGEDSSNDASDLPVELNDAIRITFKNLTLTSDDDINNLQCRRLDEFSSLWSNDSCITVSAMGSDVVCHCSQHYGYFSLFRLTTVLTTAAETTPIMTNASTSPPRFTTTLLTFEPSPIITRPTQEVACKLPRVLANTCERKCLDRCYKEGTHCHDICVVGESCICPRGTFRTENGECSSADECNARRGPSSLSVAAIVGLTIAIVAVSIALIVVAYMFYRKSQRVQVTPTNSAVDMRKSNAVVNQAFDEDETSFIDKKPEAQEKAGASNVYTMEPTAPAIMDAPPKYSRIPPGEPDAESASSSQSATV